MNERLRETYRDRSRCRALTARNSPRFGLQRSALRIFPFAAGALFFVMLVAWLAVDQAAAQQKYSPEDPVVQEMIARGMAFIAEDPSRLFGENVVFALAAYKAGVISGADDPKAHPLIDRALAQINQLNEGALGNSASFRTMYASALATVLLLELDAKKHEAKIQLLLDHIGDRQQASGAWGYTDYPQVGDTSQMQYIALALWLAKHHGFRVDPQVCKRGLDWMIEWQMPDGGWIYQQPTGIVPTAGPGATTVRHSLVAAGLGTVYLYADILQLFERQSARMNVVQDDIFLDLPEAVYEITWEAESDQNSGDRRALVQMDAGQVRSTIGRGNAWFTRNFEVEVEEYNLYYLYGFERYISMRQYLDGDIGRGGGIETWYDDGVDFLRSIQEADGRMTRPGDEISAAVDTAFAVLFLTQSMSITLGDNSSSLLNGHEGFTPNTILQESDEGGIRTGEIERSVTEFLSVMDTSESSEMEMFARSLEGMALDGEEVARGQQLAQLRLLVKHENYAARMVTIKYLARQRSIENVPALVFALTDPDPRIVHEANKGLMFVSRKTDGSMLSEEPTLTEKQNAVREWSDWYGRVRPDGQLLELPDDFK